MTQADTSSTSAGRAAAAATAAAVVVGGLSRQSAAFVSAPSLPADAAARVQGAAAGAVQGAARSATDAAAPPSSSSAMSLAARIGSAAAAAAAVAGRFGGRRGVATPAAGRRLQILSSQLGCAHKATLASRSQLAGRRLSSVATAAEMPDTAVADVKTAPVEYFRKDYKQPNYWIREVQLDVKIFDGETKVEAMLHCELNTSVASPGADMFLDGEDLKLESVEVLPAGGAGEGRVLSAGPQGYELSEEGMTIHGLSDSSFCLRTRVTIEPEKNTQLSGLYFSGCMYCTQMEALGFRRFTYFLDRPDNMAKYTKTRIEANKEKCPILLGNGNKIEEGACADDASRHYAVFEDPFAKPSYLFAVVAGDLGGIKDTFTTASGRKVNLEVYSEHANVDQLDHAMLSLKNCMKWDEDRFGLEYDLDDYKIVAVNDFNMGAMENKGLNVFNTSLTLARPDTATDGDYERIEGVIGHEYFHNWTGNRVTCRDWFQLTLKEGLTVFRDQEFSGDMGSPAVKRIEEVRILRAAQFPEDGGPLAHPIRPESYIAMDNFYTATVYCKGAEVIRMYQTLLGREGFRKGMDLYFKRHDGDAVSCDDFRAAMSDANGKDLTQFEEWYLQAGTPTVEVESSWDAASGTYNLKLRQLVGKNNEHLPEEKRRAKAMLIPVVVGLLDKATGKEVVPSKVLELTEAEQTFSFPGLSAEPVPSLLRDFSAPVKLEYAYADEDLALLAGNDTDSFNRWEAAQKLGSKAILDAYATGATETVELTPSFLNAMKQILNDRETKDISLLAYALTLPSTSTLLATMTPPIDPLKLHKARGAVRKSLSVALAADFETRYADMSPAPGEKLVIDGLNAGKRRLRNLCLAYLATAKDAAAIKRCSAQYDEARARGCMTDKLSALACLIDMPEAPETAAAVKSFYEDAKGDALVVNKWFSMQASADVPDALERTKALMKHPDFTLKNPNRLRSVVGAFLGNTTGFHNADGSGYAFLAETTLEVDKLNPQVASRFAKTLSTWPRLDAERQAAIKAQLKMLSGKSAELSKDTYEVVTTIAKEP
eukprot:TRINITY_DN111332_c0_g1_i1.p1 TRINITY_DN111332_c0_g1~~TRINITY_DN111332_c0_g1_i1.p1  ORF type:complete len:1064 (+),score=335.62 TRINITY_DN111332_c0_g1_i1:38-3193(+)